MSPKRCSTGAGWSAFDPRHSFRGADRQVLVASNQCERLDRPSEPSSSLVLPPHMASTNPQLSRRGGRHLEVAPPGTRASPVGRSCLRARLPLATAGSPTGGRSSTDSKCRSSFAASERISLIFHKHLGVDASLFEDRTQRALGHVTGVIGDGGVSIQRRVEPDFLAACGLPVELESQLFQPFDDLAVAVARQHAHQLATISG